MIHMAVDVSSLVAGLEAFGARGRAAVTAGVDAGANVAESAIKKQLSTYGQHRRGTPTPSPKDHPPAPVSGTLRRGVEKQVRVGYVDVGPTVIYGRIQELGGTTGRGHRTTLPARPYVQPAFEASKGDIEAAAIAAIRRTLGL
ncbi:hypothetical protein [Frankia sp. AgW1.1]|uniref:hypothetical protein n=1 Tax=Frankia sp. AgW1.1 TaxID=1836971 RepID=UPI0019343054|nr:hypothetical protein [Frankia sp. AgW1.1]MBL7487077.1 hypothetical protein [Frankia sp. AgW1.1]